MSTDLAALLAADADGGEHGPCGTCGHARLSVPALGGVDLTLCWCVAAYPYKGALRFGVAYCVHAGCQCRPAGHSASDGALTGRARWVLARGPRQALGSEMTLCGGCYRRLRDRVRPATADEITTAEGIRNER